MSLIDLHICKNSIKSDDATLSDPCVCYPEYYCLDYCCEEASLSTLISWQHFPRSTSSRSRCEESSEESTLCFSETITPTVKEEEEPQSTQVSSTEYPRIHSIAQLEALHYLGIRHVFHFLNYLISQLVCNEPEDPVQFLVDLLNKCLKFRDQFGAPPLLFTHAHVKSLYNAFDPFERGYLTLEQYHEGMRALGLGNGPTTYNQEPPVNDEGFVNESDFIFEANNRLLDNLKKMLRIPKNWEENRLRWKRRMKKKMEKMKTKEIKETVEFDRISEGKEEEERQPCVPPEFESDICTCHPVPKVANMNNGPVQLFLD